MDHTERESLRDGVSDGNFGGEAPNTQRKYGTVWTRLNQYARIERNASNKKALRLSIGLTVGRVALPVQAIPQTMAFSL